MKMKVYESFSDWKKDQSAKNKRLIGALELLVKKTAPHLNTSVKWGQGCWLDGKEPKMYMHTEDDHVQFGFYRGATMKDPNKLLHGSGKYVRHIKVRSVKDVDAQSFGELILQVCHT